MELQQSELVGLLIARRTDVRPFTPAQIKLLETFAHQAVMLLRMFGYSRNSRNRWNSKLRRVEILGVIVSSPTDIQPVLDTVAEECGANLWSR